MWPCLRRSSLICNAVHSLLIVLEHLHTKISRCNAVPFLQHTAFYISLLSCYFNLAKATEGRLPKDYLRVELSKKSAYPAIDFHFLCSELEFVFLAGSCSVLIIPTAPRVFSETPFLNGVGFTSALVKWNTFSGDGSQTESNHYFKKETHFDWWERVWERPNTS